LEFSDTVALFCNVLSIGDLKLLAIRVSMTIKRKNLEI